MKVDKIYTKEELIANWKNYSGGVAMITQPLPPPTLSFIGDEGKEVFKFESNGNIYINGVLAKSDKEVVEGLVEFVNEGHKWKKKHDDLGKEWKKYTLEWQKTIEELEAESLAKDQKIKELEEYKFKYEGLDK